MGLDMFMYRRKKNDDVKNADEVAYWRKANQIRQWIVDHTEMNYDDNCEIIPMTKDLLEQLIADCQKVIDNHNLAEDIIPTQPGFFFGSYDYDDWYFEQLQDTIRQIKNILESTDFDSEVIEYSEWW